MTRSAVFALALLLSTLPAAGQGIGLEQLKHMMDWRPTAFVLAEVLEVAPGVDQRPIRYDLVGWWGDADDRVWLKADGAQLTEESAGEAELQVLYGRLVRPNWDAQVGLRFDAEYGNGGTDTRAHLALGVQGLAPYRFELEPTLFVSQDGDVSATLTTSYDVLITQRLVVQPRLEVGAALQAVREWGVGEGVNDLDLGVRVRYEIRPELAPYIGFAWSRRFGQTADLARARGEAVDGSSLVAGVRFWM